MLSQDVYVNLWIWMVSTFTGDNALTNWASLATVSAVVSSAIAYFTGEKRKEKERRKKEEEERSRISRNLYGELHDGLQGLNDEKYLNDFRTISMPEKDDVHYMNRFLNHDIYDSLIMSGKINFLMYELQQEVQDIFNRIKKHNYYVTLTAETIDGEKGNVTDLIYSYCKYMDDNEQHLLKDIPDMMDRLKKDFKFEPIDN